MTKSTITREWLQHQISAIEAVGITDSNTLAAFKLALAAMDSEPVAWRWRWSDDAEGYWRYTEEQRETRGSVTAQPLYSHAQQPVVPDKMSYQDGVLFVLNNDMSSIERGTVAMRAWNACRAAMLAAAPQEVQVVPEKIEQSRKRVDRCDVCTEGARGGCGTCIFNGNFE